MKTHTTTAGEAFDAIAYRLWGREAMLHHLVAANPEHLDVLLFPAGVVLKVPDVKAPARKLDLPPWMS